MKKAYVNFKGLSQAQNGGNKEYVFLTDIDDLELEDVVVVQSYDSIALANFKGYEDAETTIEPHKWIISKVDVQKDKELKEMEAKKKKLKEQMDERFSLYSEVDLFRLIAEYDETMKELVEKHDQLTGENPRMTPKGQIKSAALKRMY